MPKILVVFYSRTGRTAAVADALARGAETVRFTEVELRRVGDPMASDGPESSPAAAEPRPIAGSRHRMLGSVDELAGYDALVIGAPADAGLPDGIERLLEEAKSLAGSGALANTVASAFASSPVAEAREGARWRILQRVAGLGMLVVPPEFGQPDASGGGPEGPGEAELAAAHALGRRVARVTGWVAHALGHEHGAHGHEHEHGAHAHGEGGHGHSHGGHHHH
jgi:NAD(P)H dehydrogenase (quinone)